MEARRCHHHGRRRRRHHRGFGDGRKTSSPVNLGFPTVKLVWFGCKIRKPRSGRACLPRARISSYALAIVDTAHLNRKKSTASATIRFTPPLPRAAHAVVSLHLPSRSRRPVLCSSEQATGGELLSSKLPLSFFRLRSISPQFLALLGRTDCYAQVD